MPQLLRNIYLPSSELVPLTDDCWYLKAWQQSHTFLDDPDLEIICAWSFENKYECLQVEIFNSYFRVLS